MSDAPTDGGPDEPLIDPPAMFRNIVAELQREPQRYRLFGVYWWAIKALLKRHGYTQTDLPMLGGYQDPDTASLVPKLHLPEMLKAAVEEYAFNAAFLHSDGSVEAPDGSLVQIIDQDAGL